MKKIIFATIAFVAIFSMASCQKDDEDSSASIVGTWETSDSKFEYQDKNGEILSEEEFYYRVLKQQLEEAHEAYTEEELRKQAADIANTPQDTMRFVFGADGSIKYSIKFIESDDYKDEVTGTYKLDGNKLSYTFIEDAVNTTATVTVLSLTETELKIRFDNPKDALTKEIFSMLDDIFGSSGDYDMILVETLKRVK